MIETIKKIARQTSQAQKPAAILFGTVETASPLTIRVDNRFVIGEEDLILPRELKAGIYSTHTHTVPAHSALSGGTPAHVHGVAEQTTAPESETYYGLQAGEQVILLRNDGGQEFYVLGRL